MTSVDTAEREFVEQIASFYETRGLSPTAGRILGRLLVAKPAAQSSKQLAKYINASKGAISSQTQFLMLAGFVEKSRRAGSRETWYALQDDVWLRLLEREVEGTTFSRQLADGLLQVYEGTLDLPSENLTEFHSFQSFVERRVPSLIAEWEALKSSDD